MSAGDKSSEEKILARLAETATRATDPEVLAQASMALSLKRIADALEWIEARMKR